MCEFIFYHEEGKRALVVGNCYVLENQAWAARIISPKPFKCVRLWLDDYATPATLLDERLNRIAFPSIVGSDLHKKEFVSLAAKRLQNPGKCCGFSEADAVTAAFQ